MKKRIIAILCVLLCAFGAFASEVKAEQSAWIGIDFAYYFKADNVPVAGTTWAPLTGAYSGLEGRITPWYEVKVLTPGKSALTSGNNVKFQNGVELTPVSVMAKTKIVYEPIAFLNFSAGCDVGTGWDCGTFLAGGMSAFNTRDTDGVPTYYPLEPCNNFFLQPWAEALFQFDLAALMPADKQDKTHVVIQATYKVMYTEFSATTFGPWEWQLTKDKFNGWNWESYVTLGYQLPESVKALRLVGIQASFESFFNNEALFFNTAYSTGSNYDTRFVTIGLNPTMIFNFDAHNTLAFQVRFKDRRSFADNKNTSCAGTVIGDEWYFDRVALSYTYKF